MKKITYTKAGMRAADKYVKENYDKIIAKIPKGRKGAVSDFAKQRGESVNGLINRLLRAELGLTEEEWKNGQKEEV